MRVIVAAGGTGGHVYPAIALCEYLMKYKNCEVLFVGVNGKMEAKVVPSYHIPFLGIDAKGFVGNVVSRIECIKMMLDNKKKMVKRMKKWKPDIVVGFGGYVSMPVCLAAHSLHVPILLHEQNSVSGLANKVLGKISDGIVICFESARAYFPKNKTRLLGSPRATSIYEAPKDKTILAELSIEGNLPLCLIVMGSLGSESVNQHMVEILDYFSKNKELEIVYVTGPSHYDEMKAMLPRLQSHIHIVDFVDQARLMKHLDMIVCRAGATTLAEIQAIGIPSIIIPSPYVAHNHQVMNARTLEKEKACFVVEEKDLTGKEMIGKMHTLLNDDALRNEFKHNCAKLGFVHASEDMYAFMEELINK